MIVVLGGGFRPIHLIGVAQHAILAPEGKQASLAGYSPTSFFSRHSEMRTLAREYRRMPVALGVVSDFQL